MSDIALKVLAGAGFAAIAVALSLRFNLGHAREMAVAAVRAFVQLAVVGALIALVFEYPALAFAFVAAMVATAGLTSGGRLRGLPRARARALVAIALPALTATVVLLAVGAFDFDARSAVPTAGILIGGAMAATTLTGRRLLESLRDDVPEIETRLALGDSARTALAPAIHRAVHTGFPGRSSGSSSAARRRRRRPPRSSSCCLPCWRSSCAPGCCSQSSRSAP